MDHFSNSERQPEKINDDEYREIDYPNGRGSEGETEENVNKEWMMSRQKKREGEDGETGNARSSALSQSRSSKKKKNIKMELPRAKLVLQILAVAAVCCNIYYLLNFMKTPFSPFYHTFFNIGLSACINFAAVWILFYKNKIMRFYLSIAAILGSFGYYFYVNYLDQSFLGNNLMISVLVIISVLMAIYPKVNYYLRSIIFLVIPVFGIYLSSNKFAIVWGLMMSAGLILFFRMSKSKPKEDKKESRARRNQKQSA